MIRPVKAFGNPSVLGARNALCGRSIKLVALFLLLFVFQVNCMSPIQQAAADKVQALDRVHRQSVPGVNVLPKGRLTKAEMGEVYMRLDEDIIYKDERAYLRRNLIGISAFLRKANPRFNEMVGSASNVLLLDAYISVVCNIPIFAACDHHLQHAISSLRNDCLARPFFISDDVNNTEFLRRYANTGGTLRDALMDFLCTAASYKPETANNAVTDQTRICPEHMLDHFVSSDDTRTTFPGYFISETYRSKAENKVIAASIIESFLNTKMNAMFFKTDVRYDKVVAIVLYKNFITGEVRHLGKTISGTQFIAFSTSARRDVFFPTNWVKLVIEFKKLKNGVPLFIMSSAYPDAIGFSQAEALDFQKK